MLQLFRAMDILQDTFDKYAGTEGDSKTLTKAELADLLRNEYPKAGAIYEDKTDEFFAQLDADSDTVVDFNEYVTFVAALSVIRRDDPSAGVTMLGLIQAMAILQETFDKYAGKEGDSNTLTKAELAELLRNECPITGPAEQCADQAANQSNLPDVFSMLDRDFDDVVDYQEYVSFVAMVSIACRQK